MPLQWPNQEPILGGPEHIMYEYGQFFFFFDKYEYGQINIVPFMKIEPNQYEFVYFDLKPDFTKKYLS
jgi:hypothetical protein